MTNAWQTMASAYDRMAKMAVNVNVDVNVDVNVNVYILSTSQSRILPTTFYFLYVGRHQVSTDLSGRKE